MPLAYTHVLALSTPPVLAQHLMCQMPPAHQDVAQFVRAARQRRAQQVQTVARGTGGGTVKPGNRPQVRRSFTTKHVSVGFVTFSQFFFFV